MLADAGLEMIVIYVTLYQNTVAQYISTRPIFDILMEEERRSGSPELLWW